MFTVEIHATSHIGRVRKGNEDNYLLLNISRSKAWTSSQENGELVMERKLIDAQQISAEEAETHTLKNVILQALGAQNEIYPVSLRIEPRRNDVFLLCSDGLSNKVNAGEMQRIILENLDRLEQACAELVMEA